MDADEEAGRANPYLDEFLPADLDELLPFADDTFDLVYANFVVEHLARPERAFSEWRRVLRPGGTLVLLTSNRASPLMAAADRLPQRLRLSIKRRGAGAVERDVYPTRYLANTLSGLPRLPRRRGSRRSRSSTSARCSRGVGRLRDDASSGRASLTIVASYR